MILTLSLTVEEFASRRRGSQDRFADALRPVIEEALRENNWAPLLVEVERLYHEAYAEETGDREGFPPPSNWLQGLEATLEKTKGREQPTVDRIALWLAAALINVAAMQAASADDEAVWLEWVTMHDDNVRTEHRATEGQQRPVGEPFDVAGVPMDYPGDSRAPIDLWINCRCTLRPVLATEALVADATHYWRDVSSEERDRLKDEGKAMPDGSYPIANCSDLRNAIQAIGRAKDPEAVKRHIKKRARALDCGDDVLPDEWSLTAATDTRDSLVVVALPAEADAFPGEEQKHVTLLYLGDGAESLVETVQGITEDLAGKFGPIQASVAGHGVLGPDQAKVLLLEAHDFNAIHGALEEDEGIADALLALDTHPHFIPHMTLTYGDSPEVSEHLGQTITFDRLAVWHGDEQTEYPLGDGGMDDEALTAAAVADVRVPWHGILAPENVRSGDGRKFKEGALRHRDLPLPLTWQKISDDGHKGNVTVATIEQIEKVDGMLRASGYFLNTPEADEVTGLIAEFGRFGVSVDADDATFEMDEENEEVVFTDARVCSACIVPIPAFAEAWVALGTWADDEAEGHPAPEPVAADSDSAEFADVAPGRTEDGPGWLTHPVDTDRLRDYWVRGPGAAKIGWGTPGDFNRCRANVAEYVKPQHINGYCANRHYDALGRWPGPGKGRHAAESLEFTEAAEAMSITAAAATIKPPAEWFRNPDLDGPTPLTVTEEGRVFGHIATWGTCHIGFDGTCVEPPHSVTDYAYFKTGEVVLDNGERVAVGNLTIGGGHAAPNLGYKPALAHYDSTSTVAADVNVGEDDHGIWFAGWIRPGTPDEMVYALRASALSGDWRKVGANLELVAALAVNVPGFGIPRPKVAASSGGQISLVASGIVPPRKEDQPSRAEAEKIADSLAASVAAILEERAARRAKMQALAARITKE